ncbi:MAG TPA: hypothetical protein VGX52_14610 [Burkholderiales bacterium]|nr:hypothetical protein [Burkholderiales bacterium]
MALAVLFALAAATGAAQPGKRQDGAREQRQMSQEERQRMRDDVREAYRERQERPQKARQQQMSPEERGRLRRDIEDANRNLKR